MNDKLAPFSGEKYLNLRTYRKSGEAVPTPVWFVQEEDALYVRTGAQSGKVRRLTRSPRVDVAPCDYSGKLHAEWQVAEAHVVQGEVAARVNQLLRRKYGLQKRLADLLGFMGPDQTATVEIQLN